MGVATAANVRGPADVKPMDVARHETRLGPLFTPLFQVRTRLSISQKFLSEIDQLAACVAHRCLDDGARWRRPPPEGRAVASPRASARGQASLWLSLYGRPRQFFALAPSNLGEERLRRRRI
jgi:hypothetical protein